MTVVDFGNIRVADKAARDRFRTALSVDDRAACDAVHFAVTGVGAEYIDHARRQIDKFIERADLTCIDHAGFAHMSDKSADVVQALNLVEIIDLGIVDDSVHHCAAEAARAAGISRFAQSCQCILLVSADNDTVAYAVDLALVDLRTEHTEYVDLLCGHSIHQNTRMRVIGNLRNTCHVGISEKAARVILSVYTAQVFDNDVAWTGFGGNVVLISDDRRREGACETACVQRDLAIHTLNHKAEGAVGGVCLCVIDGCDGRIQNRYQIRR